MAERRTSTSASARGWGSDSAAFKDASSRVSASVAVGRSQSGSLHPAPRDVRSRARVHWVPSPTPVVDRWRTDWARPVETTRACLGSIGPGVRSRPHRVSRHPILSASRVRRFGSAALQQAGSSAHNQPATLRGRVHGTFVWAFPVQHKPGSRDWNPLSRARTRETMRHAIRRSVRFVHRVVRWLDTARAQPWTHSVPAE